jgi:hypothetical protein
VGGGGGIVGRGVAKNEEEKSSSTRHAKLLLERKGTKRRGIERVRSVLAQVSPPEMKE